MFKYIVSLANTIKGEVLTIGVYDKILKGFKKNGNVDVYTLDRCIKSSGSTKKLKYNKGKNINIKRLKKYFKKRYFNYIICNYDEIKDYQKYVIKDLLYINSGKIYLYCSNNESITLIDKRIRRYGSIVNTKEYGNKVLFEIDNHNYKSNWFLNKYYYFSDTMYNLVEIISNILTN